MTTKGTKHLMTKWTPKQKAEALAGVRTGATIPEVAEITGIPDGTIRHWCKLERIKATPAPKGPTCEARNRSVAPVAPVAEGGIAVVSPPKMTLDEFVSMLRSLVTDYELVKTKLHKLENDVERWQKLAGSLNDQLQSGFGK